MDRVAIIIFKDEKYAYIRLSPKMLHKRRPVCNKRVTHSECFTIQTHPFEQLMHIPTPPPNKRRQGTGGAAADDVFQTPSS